MDKDTASQIELGRELYQNGEFEKAEPILRRIVESNPGFADMMNMLGVIYHNRGDLEMAKKHFEDALRINPRYTEAALNLVVTYNDLGKFEDSKIVFDHVMSFSGGSKGVVEPFARGKLANMHADLGRAYGDVGLFDDAIDQYRHALKLCPGFIDLRTRLAQVYQDAGHIQEAIQELETVKELRPTYLPGRLALGVAYFSLGDKETARKEWEAILEQDEKHLTAHMYLRMINQVLAQEEAAAQGMPVEVEEKPTVPVRESAANENLETLLNGYELGDLAPEDDKKPDNDPNSGHKPGS